MKPVILLEFNELCPPLMDRFIAEGHLPSFRRFRDEAQVWTTVADEVAPYLDPWIQWITVHSGVPYKQHHIKDLGEGHLLDAPNVWDLVSARGERAWVCGSMNATHQPSFRGWFIPDPWTTKTPVAPPEAKTYFDFVQANVTEYTANRMPVGPADIARFVAFMATHGMSAKTARSIARQLLSERVEPRKRWKRAVLLDRMQMDLFKWVWKTERPAFSTFFLNSTAHFQHVYWRHMAPEQFSIRPAPEELAAYRDAIRFGYQNMDALLGEFMELAGSDVTLVFSTAFSQQPFLAYEDAGGKVPYRPIDFERFCADVGIARATASPVMAHQFHLDFATEDDAKKAAARLESLRYEGKQAMMVERTGAKIFGGCQIYSAVPEDAVLRVEGSDEQLPFFGLFYKIELMKSGMHHPDGMFWVRTPERTHAEHPDKAALVDVAPTLCTLLGIEPPATMVGKPLTTASRARAAASSPHAA